MIRLLSLVAVLILTLGVACTGDDDADDAPAATPTTAVGTQPTPTAEPDDDDGTDIGDLEGDPAVGEQLAQSSGCVACHSTDGSQGVGPTWQGLWMSEVELQGGETVTADAEYIRTSILQPTAQIHAGFAPAMPSFEGQLDDQEIADLIAYIQTLE